MMKTHSLSSRVILRRRNKSFLYKLSFWYLIVIFLLLSGAMLLDVNYDARVVYSLLLIYIITICCISIFFAIKNRKILKIKHPSPY